MTILAQVAAELKKIAATLSRVSGTIRESVGSASARVLSSTSRVLREVAGEIGATKRRLERRAAPRRVRPRGRSIADRERITYRFHWVDRHGKDVYRTHIYSTRSGLTDSERLELGVNLARSIKENTTSMDVTGGGLASDGTGVMILRIE